MAVGEVHKPLQRFGVQNIVRIDKGDVFGAHGIERGVTCRRWSAVGTRHQPNTLVSEGVFGCYVGCCVCGTVINNYRLPVVERLREDAVKAFGNPGSGIESRDDNSDEFHRGIEL